MTSKLGAVWSSRLAPFNLLILFLRAMTFVPRHNADLMTCWYRRAGRYKKHKKKAPLKENLQGLKTRVVQAGAFYRQIESVIPRDIYMYEVYNILR